MSERLNFRDRRVVRSFMRPGLIVGLVIMIGAICASYFISYLNSENEELANIIMICGVLLGVILLWIMNKKYIKDLSKGIKHVEVGSVEKKYNVGEKYTFVINGVEYDVDKDIFDSATEGDKVEVHYSFKSRILLEVRLTDKAVSCYY